MKRTGDAGDRQWFRCLRTSIVRPSGVLIPHKDPVLAHGPVCLLDDADPWYYSNAINAYRREMPVEWALSDSDARLRLGSYTEIARWRAVWLDLWGAFAAFAWQVSREELDARGMKQTATALPVFDHRAALARTNRSDDWGEALLAVTNLAEGDIVPVFVWLREQDALIAPRTRRTAIHYPIDVERALDILDYPAIAQAVIDDVGA